MVRNALSALAELRPRILRLSSERQHNTFVVIHFHPIDLYLKNGVAISLDPEQPRVLGNEFWTISFTEL